MNEVRLDVANDIRNGERERGGEEEIKKIKACASDNNKFRSQ